MNEPTPELLGGEPVVTSAEQLLAQLQALLPMPNELCVECGDRFKHHREGIRCGGGNCASKHYVCQYFIWSKYHAK